MNWIFETDNWLGAGVEVSLRLANKVSVEPGPSGGCVISHPWGQVELQRLSQSLLHGLLALGRGWLSRAELWSLAEGDDADAQDAIRETAELLWILEQWPFLFRLRLSSAGIPRLDVEPCAANARLRPTETKPASVRLSPFAYLRQTAAGLVLESPLSPHRITICDARAAHIVLRITDAPIGCGEEWLELLLDAAGMLERSENPGDVGVDPALAEMAEFHDLLFHRRSRFGHHDQEFGATFPFLSDRPPAPAFPIREGQSIALPIPSSNEVAARDLSLTQALERRSSQRDYAGKVMPLEELAEFLFRCARIRGVYGPLPDAGMPYEVSERPYPSGGGSYDLELYVLADRVVGLDRGIYHYAADRHALSAIAAEDHDLDAMLLGALRASGASKPPQVLLEITSRFERLAWKYRSISYAVSLKNVGVLYQTMYLVATSMGLAACGLGSGNDLITGGVLDLARNGELPVGEFMLGCPLTTASPIPWRRTLDSWRSLVAPGWERQ